MSLNAALNVAKSGLATTAARAEVTSRNIANADTEGYVRKLDKAVTGAGGTVSLGKIDRQVDTLLNRLDRSGLSSLAAATARADGMAAYTDVLGQPNAETSPAAALARLQASLVTLSANPDSRVAQSATVLAAQELAGNLNSLSATLGDVAAEVDASIRLDVADMNAALQTVAQLNVQIDRAGTGMTTAEQQDALDAALDRIAGFMDVQITRDARGRTQIHSGGGTELLVGGQVMTLRYDSTTGTLLAGDQNITPGQTTRGFSAGSLAGLYDLRDRVLPGWSAELDTVAAGLIEASGRLSPISGGAGIFTDEGLAYDPARQQGMAARIVVNAAVDPAQGGDLQRVQNGGDASLPRGDLQAIQGLQTALTAAPVVAGAGSAASLTGFVTAVVSAQQGARAEAQSAQSRIAAQANTVSASRSNIQSVDMDEELQSLLAIQQAYAANARIISAVSGMLDDLISAV